MLIKRILLTTLLITWMIIIFMFSSEKATNSQNTSDKVANTAINTVTTVTNTKITKEKRNTLIEHTRLLVRKSAHFFLYFILGILVYLTLNSYGINNRLILYSIIFCFIYCVSDEIHQIFSDGRTFKVLDICIDTIASSISIFITSLIRRKVKFL